jgi:hypothetical protein
MRKLSLISFISAVSGIIILLSILPLSSLFYESTVMDRILAYLRIVFLMLLILALITGLISLIWLKIKGGDVKERSYALKGIMMSLFPLMIILFFVGGFWMRSYSGRFKECDPNKLISIIKENYNFELPDKMDELKAAEGALHGIDHTYLFLFKFNTNQEGWEKFRTSICMTQSDNDKFFDENLCWDDWEDISGKDKAFSDHHRTPKWYKAKVLRGKRFMNQLIGKEHYDIYIVYADISVADKIVVYIVITKPML